MPAYYIWLDDDDTRKQPEFDHLHFHSVNEVKYFIENHKGIYVLDLDHDLGEYACDGGDAIKLIYWLIENGYNENTNYTFSFNLHTMNPVGRENMKSMIERYF